VININPILIDRFYGAGALADAPIAGHLTDDGRAISERNDRDLEISCLALAQR